MAGKAGLDVAINVATAAVEEQAEIPVVVAVHIRPLIYDELIQGCRECFRVTEGEPQV